MQSVAARNFASQAHPVFCAANAVWWIKLAAANSLRFVGTDAVVDALRYLAAGALPSWDAFALLGGKVARTVAGAALAANTRTCAFIADGTKPTLTRLVARACLDALVVCVAFALIVTDFVAASSRVARVAAALSAVHWTLHTIGALNCATRTHPSLLAAFAYGKADGCGALAFAIVAIAAARAVEQLAPFAAPPCVTSALLLVQIARAVAGAVDIVHARTSLFEAEFASPARSRVWILAFRLWRAITTLDVWLAVFLGGFALTFRNIRVADRVAVWRWDACIVADTNTAVSHFLFAKLGIFAATNMLTRLDAHPALLVSAALLAFWILKRQANAFTNAGALLVVLATRATDRLVACFTVPADFAGALARFLVAFASARAVFLDTWASFFCAELAPVPLGRFGANALLVFAFTDVGAFHCAVIAVEAIATITDVSFRVEDALASFAIAQTIFDAHFARWTLDAADSVGAWDDTARAAVTFVLSAIWSFTASTFPAGLASALEGALVTFAVRNRDFAVLVTGARERHSNFGDFSLAGYVENGRGGTRATRIFTRLALEAFVKVAEARAVCNFGCLLAVRVEALALVIATANTVAANSTRTSGTDATFLLVFELANHAVKLASNASKFVFAFALLGLAVALTPLWVAARRIAVASWFVARMADPLWVAGALLFRSVALTVGVASTLWTGAGLLLAEFALPRVAGLSRSADTLAVLDRPMAGAFKVATVAGPPSGALADVSFCVVNAVIARLFTGNAHPSHKVVAFSASGAINADWPVKTAVCIARATVVAVWVSRAVDLVAPDLSPARVASALCKSRVAVAMPSAIFVVFTWTASNFANVATETLCIIALARAVGLSSTVAGAFDVATFAGPSLFTLANTGIHWLLLPVGARIGARWAHPSCFATLANWGVKFMVAVTLVATIWLAWAIWCLATRALPACFAAARGVGRVAFAMAAARLADLRAVKAAQTADARCRVLPRQAVGSVGAVGIFKASAVAGASWITTKCTPEPSGIITDARRLVGRVNLAVAGAFRVAAFASPTSLALAVARVHRSLLAVDARFFARCAHPVFVTLDTLWRVKIHLVARAAVVATWIARAVCLFATFALPTRIAVAHRGGIVAFAVARARQALFHTVNGREIAVTWASRFFTVLAPEPFVIVADAKLVGGIVFAVATAFKVAAVAIITSIADTFARVHRFLLAMDARLLAASAHPTRDIAVGFCAVDAHRGLQGIVALATIVAVWFARAIGNMAARAGPTFEAGARGLSRVAVTVARAVFAV